MANTSGSEDDANTMLLGVLGDQAAARYGSDHQSDYISVDDVRPQYEGNIKKIKDTIDTGKYTGKGLDNLQSDMADQQNRLDALMGPPMESTPIDPTDLSQIITLPTSPSAKRNAIASGLEGPYSKELTNQIANIVPEAEAQKQEIRNNSNVMQSFFGDQINSAKNLANLKSQEVLLKQQHAAERTAEAAGIIQRSGIDIGDINSTVNQAAMTLPSLYLQMDSLKKDIEAKSNTSFLESPVDWIMNQFTVSDDVRKHNQLAQRYNQAEEFVKSAPAAIRTAIDSNAPKYSAMSNAEAQNLAEQQRIIAEDKVAKLQEEAIKNGVATAKDIRTVERQKTADLLTAETRSINLSDKMLREKEAEQKNSINALIRERELEDKTARAAARKTVEDDKDFLNQRISLAIGPTLGIQTIDEYKRLTGPKKKLAENMIESYTDERGVKLGVNPVDTLSVMQIAGPRAIENEAQGKMMSVVKMWSDEWKNSAEGVQAKLQGKKPEDIAQMQNQYINSKMNSWMNNPSTQGPALPTGESWKGFNIPPIVDTASQASLGSNKFAIETNLLNSTLPSGVPVTPEMVLTSLAAKSMNDPKMLNQSAKDIAEFYKYGVGVVNQTLKPDRFGLPTFEKFPVPINSGFLFGGTVKSDLASAKGAYEALIRIQMKSKISEAVEAGLNITTP